MTTERTMVSPCDVAAGTQALADQYSELVRSHSEPLVQSCDTCEAIYFPPLLSCRTCHSFDLSWIRCGTTGTIGTYVTVHTADATPSMSIPRRLLDQIPYTSVYVVPDAVPTVRVPALMVGDQQQRIAVGAAVTLRFDGGPALADLSS